MSGSPSVNKMARRHRDQPHTTTLRSTRWCVCGGGGRFTIIGTVAPGYEPVRAQFERHFSDNLDDEAQCVVFVDGEKVVDLVGRRADDPDPLALGLVQYNAGSIQNVFSSGKVLTSVAVAMLVDRGVLSYDAKLADVWPQYAAHGKGDTTLAMLMRHEAGLHPLDTTINLDDLRTEAIKGGGDGSDGFTDPAGGGGAAAAAIASSVPHYVPGSKRTYQRVTRGWIVNEVVRRATLKAAAAAAAADDDDADAGHGGNRGNRAAGTTVGEFLAREVAAPLGLGEELFCGVPRERHAALASPLHATPAWWMMKHLATPAACGGKVEAGCCFRGILLCLLGCCKPMEACGCSRIPCVARKMHGKEFTLPDDLTTPRAYDVYNHADVAAAEMPSNNMHASARALATVASAMACGGAHRGVRLLSEAGVDAAHAAPDCKPTFFGAKTVFTNAGVAVFDRPGDLLRGGYVGWMGHGGSAMQWHRGQRIGFGYTCTRMSISMRNPRARRLQLLALECARRRATKKGGGAGDPDGGGGGGAARI